MRAEPAPAGADDAAAGMDILASGGRVVLPRAHARGMPKHSVSDTLAKLAGNDPRSRLRRLGREHGVTILLMYSRLWPDPG
jgi:hypothetical protein